MAKFFKTFAKGILYILALPLLIVFLAIYLVISLVSFIFLSIQGIILFFKGENLVGEMEEDRIAKERLDALAGASVVPNPTPIMPTPSVNPLPPVNNINQQVPPQPVQSNINFNQVEQPVPPSIKEAEMSLVMNQVDETKIESEDDIFTPLEEPEPEPENEDAIPPFIQHEEEIKVERNEMNDHEYIVDEPYPQEEKSGGVDLYDYEGRDK